MTFGNAEMNIFFKPFFLLTTYLLTIIGFTPVLRFYRLIIDHCNSRSMIKEGKFFFLFFFLLIENWWRNKVDNDF